MNTDQKQERDGGRNPSVGERATFGNTQQKGNEKRSKEEMIELGAGILGRTLVVTEPAAEAGPSADEAGGDEAERP